MKVKYSVIPFIPAAIVMLVFRIMSVVGADESGNFLGMDKMTMSYTVIGIAAALFIICILINIFDRKTAPVYPVKKNLPAGILAVLSGAAVIAYSVGSFINTTSDSEYYIMSLVSALFSIPAGIAFMLMSNVHLRGKSIVSGTSMLFVFPALWGCSELVYEFLNATKVSISASDLTSLFCYIFLTLYFFSHSMVVSRIKGRNPVKGCFIYGLPAVALALSHAVYTYITAAQEGMGITSTLLAVQFIVLALYAASFIAEMTLNSYTKDELEIIDGLPKDGENKEEEKYIGTKDYDDIVFSNRPSDGNPNVDPADDYYSSAKGLDDFIIGYNAPSEDEEPIPYLTKSEMKKAVDSHIVIPGVNTADAESFTEESKASGDLKDKTEKVEESKPSREKISEVRQIERELDMLASKPKPADKPELTPAVKEEPAKQAEPEKEVSDIDKLLQELDSKK